ncbi:Acyl-CoA oxidase [Mycena sanguinolenta]|uniref:short-chain 2-methylacyl-CoA dehydrogenase n=1 Tax=Mycena sanguinolenta TaxID=230812 RepID=A0A8H6Y1C3_9AGAR|nr:Acyl-CoA oxidase [Mycena sanguinolenta]
MTRFNMTLRLFITGSCPAPPEALPRLVILAKSGRTLSLLHTTTTMLRTGIRALSTVRTKPVIPSRLFTSSRYIRSDAPPLNSLDVYTEEETMLREAVQRFATDVVGPKVREMDENEQMDPAIIKGLFEQGLMGIETSAEHGGAESSFTSAIIVIEELAKVDPSVSVLCDVHNTLVNTIFRKYGTKEQQDKWLPQLASSKLGSFCLSEPASGSDAFALQTRAKKDGDSWIINGSKMWITNSYEAEIFLIFANVRPGSVQSFSRYHLDCSTRLTRAKGTKGITCFVATKDMGIQIAKKEQKLGIRASSTCTLNFDDLKIPAENIIGGEGKGYKIAIEILNEGRIGIAGQMLGLAQGAFNKAVPYTYSRSQFGRRRGKSFTKEAAMAKYWSSVVAQRVSGQAIEWAGGVGFTRETGIEKFWRDSKIGAIYEGTSNIQLQTIAKFIQKEHS